MEGLLPATKQTVAIVHYTNQLPTTDYYGDLDPHYNNIYGNPLARATLDYGNNEFNTANYIIPKMVPNTSEKWGRATLPRLLPRRPALRT